MSKSNPPDLDVSAFAVGDYGYRMREFKTPDGFTRSCGACQEPCSTLYWQLEWLAEKVEGNAVIWTLTSNPILYGHRDCLIARRR